LRLFSFQIHVIPKPDKLVEVEQQLDPLSAEQVLCSRVGTNIKLICIDIKFGSQASSEFRKFALL
jgi:hypothetical protein